MAQWLDQFGVPMKNPEKEKPYAGPTVGGVRPVISGHPAEGLGPRRLAMIHRQAAEGDPLAYFELAEDIEERDLHYLGVMSTRKRSVAQLPITVTAASDAAEHKKHADFIQSWIKDGILRASLFDMLDAIGKGLSITEISWKMHMGHMCPRELTYRPQRWFTFDRKDGETVVLRDDIYEQGLPPHLFITHRHPAKSGLTIRSGLARVASWAWMYKSFTIKDWSMFVQNFGMPIRIGKYGRNATSDDLDVLWRAVSSVAGDCAAIVPIDMQLEFVEVAAKGATTDMYEKRADWFDRQVSKAVLGQTTTTDAVSGGHAVAQEHRLVQEDIERADAMLISSTVNRQLIPNIIAFNFGPQTHYPEVLIGRPDELPLKDFSDAFEKFAKQGLTAEASFIRGRMGIPEPKEGAELVGGIKTPAAEPPLKPALNAVQSLLLSRHNRKATETTIEALTSRMESDTAGALAGVTEEIRNVLMTAHDLPEAADRLARMNLSPDALADAMARGMALAHLTGQAALLDDIGSMI